MHQAARSEQRNRIAISRLWLVLLLLPAGLYLGFPVETPAEPVFVAESVAPNTLIVMDNSASMLDLAYAPGSGGCHDDPQAAPETTAAYEKNRTYSGYFSIDDRYAYNAVAGRFELATSEASCACTRGLAYTLVQEGDDDLCLCVDGTAAALEARGNFLNWLSASRFDILKKGLTGGKYDTRERTLVSEGRGCSGNRFIRQVRVRNVMTDAQKILPLGIRPLDGDNDPTTAIEVFAPHPEGLNLEKCRTALETLSPQDYDLAFLQSLHAVCAENSGSPLDLPFSADPSGHLGPDGALHDPVALLTDALAQEQLGPPLAVLRGVIQEPQYDARPPTGILHDIVDEIRIGLMVFNRDGTRAECALEGTATRDSLLLDLSKNDCTADSRDGGRVIVEIADGTPTHLDTLTAKINEVRADAWSPLAEAVFNAVGYFTQRPDMRIDPADFAVDNPPCTHWCQGNNILVITDGVSTADLHPQVTTFASVEGQHDGTRDDTRGCPGLYGGTFLDDITAYGYAGHNIHLETPFDDREHFQGIRTFFIVLGKPASQETGECAPIALLAQAAANGASGTPYYPLEEGDVRAGLEAVFNRIRSAAGSAAATAISSARLQGGGAIYQAHFWPWIQGLPLSDPFAPGSRVAWVGDVKALLVDDHGRLFEDTDTDGALGAGDQQVVFYLDPDSKATRVCLQELAADGSCQGPSKNISETAYLWSAAAWLAGIPDADIVANRPEYISDSRQRCIFTWNDLDNNGAVGDGEILPFVPMDSWDASVFPTAADRAPVPFDFGVAATGEVNDIISWVRGLDAPQDPDRRSRSTPAPLGFGFDAGTDRITWRLGDIIHSTPTVVAAPSENYHLRYRDEEYAAFVTANAHRRQVIYFGGNDGMLHAVNGGFYDEANRKFWRGYDWRTGVFSDAGPQLGAELWAYVPYNLLPHLKSLMQTGYRHRYFVDAPPRVFDVQIFDATPDRLGHTNGWGTILVMGMRLGGDRVHARDIVADLAPDAYTDGRVFTSAYMVFDISDPEHPPRLLGELTFDPETSADLAYTTATPLVVPVKTDDRGSDWFLVLGSGPTDPAGISDQHARVAVFPLKELAAGQAFRVPAAAAWSHASPGSLALSASPDGFISGMAAVDYDLDSHYKTDVLYFGTIEGCQGAWGGRLYRWVTDDGYPQNWYEPRVMFDAQRPITAPPGIGFDGSFYWLYFGTGRFFDARDADPASDGGDFFFGLKEPVNAATGAPTWAAVANDPAASKPQPGNNAGARTLLPVDQIGVKAAASPSAAGLYCLDNSACLPDGVSTFKALQRYIVGSCDPGVGCTGTDGWVLALPEEERVLGPNTLLSGLVTFTSYQPPEDFCRPEGHAFYYAVHYQTGTAFWEPAFPAPAGDDFSGTTGDVSPFAATRIAIGRGFATAPSLHVGRLPGTRAFIGTGSGAIVQVPLPNLPVKNTRSGRISWRRY